MYFGSTSRLASPPRLVDVDLLIDNQGRPTQLLRQLSDQPQTRHPCGATGLPILYPKRQ